jgi:hypothetical protein
MHPRYIFLIFVLASLSCSTTKGQDVFKKNDCLVDPDTYFEKKEIARLKFKKQEYELSYKMFKCAFGTDHHLLNRGDAIKMANSCFETGRSNEAGKFLEQSVLAGANIEIIEKSSSLEKYYSHPAFISFRKNYSGVLKLKQHRIDTSFARIVNELIALDMAARKDSTISDDSVTNVDIRNARVLRAVIESKGLPCFEAVNHEDHAALYGLVLHFTYYEESAEYFIVQAYRLLERRIIEPELYNYLLKRSKQNHDFIGAKWSGENLLNKGTIKTIQDISSIIDSDSLFLHKMKDCL